MGQTSQEIFDTFDWDGDGWKPYQQTQSDWFVEAVEYVVEPGGQSVQDSLPTEAFQDPTAHGVRIPPAICIPLAAAIEALLENGIIPCGGRRHG